ncbi:MAG: VCBS repeat-containing protein [Kiritimatiellae bacterium]|nr:VCBS repeat-containing protein [Kiritimatiellia bacterium]
MKLNSCIGLFLLTVTIVRADSSAWLSRLRDGNDAERDAAMREWVLHVADADVDLLKPLLTDSARADSASFLLTVLGTPKAQSALLEQLPKSSGTAQAAIWIALRRLGNGSAVAFAKTVCFGTGAAPSEARRYLAAFAPDAATLCDAIPMNLRGDPVWLRAAARLRDPASLAALTPMISPEMVALAIRASDPNLQGQEAFGLFRKALLSSDPVLVGTMARIFALRSEAFQKEFGPKLLAEIPDTAKVSILEQLANEKRGAFLVRQTVGERELPISVRLAAIAALGKLGTEDDVPQLLGLLGHSDGQVAKTARQSLTQLNAPGVDAAIVKSLHASKGNASFVAQLLEVLSWREAAVSSAVLPLLSDAQADVRTAAFAAVTEMAGEQDLASILAAAVRVSDQKELQSVSRTVSTLAKKYPTKMDALLIAEVAKNPAPAVCEWLIAAIGVSDTDAAVAALAKRIQTGGADADETLRVLAKSNNPASIVPLLEFAERYPNKNLGIVALRGALREMAKTQDEELLKKTTPTALRLAKRPEERMMLGSIRDPRVPGATLPSVTFRAHRIGHCRTEACGAADFNGDGKIDIIAGPYLYLAPEFKPVQVREVKSDVNEQGKGYARDFMNLPLDVNYDGKIDVISGDWFSQETWWIENKLPTAGIWTQHLIEKTGNIETGILVDLDGDGKATDFIPDTHVTCIYQRNPKQGEKPEMVRDSVTGERCDMGTGCGDLNGDGKNDILRCVAWYEKTSDGWKKHPLSIGFNDGKLGHASNLIVYDVNQDGKNDIIVSSAHRYGIFWFEQLPERDKNGELQFKKHVIDESWTQAHYLGFADITGDGVPEIIAGKRFLAHNGGDPDSAGKLGIYYYDFTPGKEPVFQKHVISYDEGISVGLNVEGVDIDGDGDIDLVTTGKWGGPVWLENLAR